MRPVLRWPCSMFAWRGGGAPGSSDSSAWRNSSSTLPPTCSSIVPPASHWPRLPDSVRYAHTRSIGPGSRRWMRAVSAAMRLAYSDVMRAFRCGWIFCCDSSAEVMRIVRQMVRHHAEFDAVLKPCLRTGKHEVEPAGRIECSGHHRIAVAAVAGFVDAHEGAIRGQRGERPRRDGARTFLAPFDRQARIA